MFPLIKIFGGGYYYKDFVIGNFPPNYEKLNFLEGCVGGGSIILNKKRSKLEVINDVDSGLISIYKQLQINPTSFIQSLSSLKYCEETFNLAKSGTLTPSSSFCNPLPIQEYVLYRMSRAGRKDCFGWSDRLRRARGAERREGY